MSEKNRFYISNPFHNTYGRVFPDIMDPFVLILSLCAGILFLSLFPVKTWGESGDSVFEGLETDWGGHFKVRGSVSRPGDETPLGLVGADTCYDGNVEARVKGRLLAGEWACLETHYEMVLSGGDTRRKVIELERLSPGLLSAGFMSVRPVDDQSRFMDLTWTIEEQEGHILYHRLDRLKLTLQSKWGTLAVGRQAVTWGNGLLFNPMDLLNPFSPSDIERDYKIGDDLASAKFSVKNLGDFQLLYVPRRDPATDYVEWNRSSIAGKLHITKDTTEFDIMTAWHYDNPVIGLGSSGYVADAAWRLDSVWSFMDDSDRRDGYLTLVANTDYSWVWLGYNFYGFLEFYLNTLCDNDYGPELTEMDITRRLERGELFTLGRTYLSGNIRWEAHPLLNISVTVINNLADPSGMIQPRALWDIKDYLRVTAGANIPYGAKETEYGGFTIPGTSFINKTPPSFFLWLSYFF